MFKKLTPNVGEKVIIKNGVTNKLEEENMAIDATCPICGYYSPFNGMIESNRLEGGFFFGKYVKYDLYTCKACGCEWEIKRG